VNRPGTRAALVAVATLALALPIVITLRAIVPDVVHTPLVPSEAGDGLPIELAYRDYNNAEGTHVAELRLLVQDFRLVAAHEAIDLLVGNNATSPRLRSATIRVDGSECRFVSSPGAGYPNNSMVRLWRNDRCGTLPPNAGPVMFEVRFDGPGQVFVWTRRAAQMEPGGLYAHDNIFVGFNYKGALLGRYVDARNAAPMRRVDLLSHMWQVAKSPAWIWVALGIATSLFAAGLALAVFHLPAALRPVGPGLMALSLASLYAVLVPPFQAPDEPSHFITYADAYARDLPAPANEWAKITHFNRLQFHFEERFKPLDAEQPLTSDWYVAVQPFARSVTGRGVAQLFHSIAGHLPLQRRFLAGRLLNAAIFAVAVALAAGVLALTAGGFHAARLLVILLSVPTWPFFAMHFSNYATLASIYVLLIAGVCAVLLDRPRASWAGPILGFSLGLALATSRSAVPMAVIVGGALLARSIIGPREAASWKDAFRHAAIFWVGYGLAVPLGAGGDAEHWRLLFEASSQLNASTAIRLHLAIVVVGLVFEVGLRPLRRRGSRPLRFAAAAGTFLLALFVASCLVASAFVDFPHLALFQIGKVPEQMEYAKAALRVGLLPFRVRDPDFLMVMTYWGGFGWLETNPGAVVVSVLVTVTSLSLLVSLIRLQDPRQRAVLLCVFLAAPIAIGGYAAGAIRLLADIHGRYLLGLYTVFVLISWMWVVGRQDEPSSVLRRTEAAWCAIAIMCAAVHGYILTFILHRYF
jgi:hypothetical protein